MSSTGQKRKASTPPPEGSSDDRPRSQSQAQHQQGAANEQHQRRTPGQHYPSAKRASPVFAPASPYFSYSSPFSAGPPNGSYASSAGVPVGSHGMANVPSAQDRLSPAGIVKPESGQEMLATQYMNSMPSLDPNLHAPPSAAYPVDAQQLAAAAAQKVSAEAENRMKSQSTAKHSANIHICDCCPKKPKKFDTLDELRHHQAEKQYECQYCHNRFKNKNEAERHQNSLHLRRHSWSCATLERNFEAAFHPCTAVPPNTSTHSQQQHPPNAVAPTDICGYCGEEFPNPPDWIVRGEHLTNVHKFGECNQSKKFFRADHFRQHLKHSHGGTSGKWTNMLEAACMKEEPPVTPEAQTQEQLRLQQQQQAQAAHAAQAAQQAAQQAQQAVQQQQQQQQQQQSQSSPPALSQYQAAQLQNATGAPVANMMGQSAMHAAPYQSLTMTPGKQSSDQISFGTITGESARQQ